MEPEKIPLSEVILRQKSKLCSSFSSEVPRFISSDVSIQPRINAETQIFKVDYWIGNGRGWSGGWYS